MDVGESGSPLQERPSVSFEVMTSMRKTIWKSVARFVRSEDGPTAVEYAVMISLILGACIVTVRSLANAARTSFDTSSQAISDAMGP